MNFLVVLAFLMLMCYFGSPNVIIFSNTVIKRNYIKI